MRLTSTVPRLSSRLHARAETRRRRRLQHVEERWRVREDWRDIKRRVTVFPGPGMATIPGGWLLCAGA